MDQINHVMNSRVKKYFIHVNQHIDQISIYNICGSVTRIVGLTIEVQGIHAPIGATCCIRVKDSGSIFGEVIGFSGNVTYIMSFSSIVGVKPGSKVYIVDEQPIVAVGEQLTGRMINALGQPLDKKGEIQYTQSYPLLSSPINPLERKRITEKLDVGIKAINTFMTVCKGQRIGIFAESGIGKSVLLGMMTHFSKADVVVVGLIGERGREVKEFIEEIIGESGLHKTVVVASPADTSPLLKAHAALRATAIAEYYRDNGKDVLLIIDSITRYAQSMREISLSCGEIPSIRGYTASVFAKLSQLVERSGNGTDNQGSITAFYTVLIDKDDMSDPVGDHVKSLIDGHIILSRELADEGHYPAIDIERSVSRVMPLVISQDILNKVITIKKIYSAYVKNKDLINMGMYQKGSDNQIDLSIKLWPRIKSFLQQGMNESFDYEACIREIDNMLNPEME